MKTQVRGGRSGENYQLCISLELKSFLMQLYSHVMYAVLNTVAKAGVNLFFVLPFIFLTLIIIII